MEKLLVACDFVGITERFMAMNDDLFFLEDVKATTYQYYYSGELIDSIDRFSKNWYNEYLALTMKALQRNECNTDNYDIHVPIIYDKELFPLIMEMYRWEEKLLVKSIYCNTINLPGIEISDCKIKGWKSEAQVKAMIKGRHIFSIGDYCLRDMPRRSPVKQLLETLYPNKSKYEK